MSNFPKFVSDIEAATERVLAGMGHAERTAEMIAVVILVAFAVDLVAGVPRAVAEGASALRHETGQDAMEHAVVVELALDETDEASNRLRRLVLEQIDHQLAFITPGTSPRLASLRKHKRHSAKRRRYARGRPHKRHRL